MATIHKEIEIERSKEFVWEIIRDVGAIHRRLVPGFVLDCKLEGDWRTVTFANGMVVRELIVSVDDSTFRHSWSARGGTLTHHNASIQVFPRGNESQIIWIADVMPNEAAGAVAGMIEQALKTMKKLSKAPQLANGTEIHHVNFVSLWFSPGIQSGRWCRCFDEL